MTGIYKIVSPSGKIYIGQSRNIKARQKSYASLDCKKQTLVYKSLLKYSWNTHRFEVVCELPEDISQEVLNEYERLYWYQYKDCGMSMLNLKEPGSSGKHSELTKQKMSDAHKGRVFTDVHKSNIANAHRGKIRPPFSEEHKQKLSKAWIGRIRAPFSEEHRNKLSQFRKGKATSEEVKSKISQTMKGRKRGPYRKKNMEI